MAGLLTARQDQRVSNVCCDEKESARHNNIRCN